MIVLWREDILVTPPSVEADPSAYSLDNWGGMLGIAAKCLYPGFPFVRQPQTGYSLVANNARTASSSQPLCQVCSRFGPSV